MFWLTAILPFLVVDDHTLRPGLPYAFPGVGLDRFDDREFLRPPLSFRHTVILLPAATAIFPERGYGIPVQVWNTSYTFGGRSFPRRRESGAQANGGTGLLRGKS